VVWWAGSFAARDSALGRLLFARDEDGNIAPTGRSTPTDAAANERFLQVAAEATGCVSVERADPGTPRSWSPPPPDGTDLCAATFDRRLDRRWRRTSYSDITRDAHGEIGDDDAWVGSEPEEPVLDDEPAAATAVAAAADAGDDALRAVPSLLAGMPHGVRAGTFVHRVLELTDFAAPDLDAELAEHVGEGIEGSGAEEVVVGLRAALETPLRPVLGGLRLRDVARADRLDELAFELPLVGGDEPSGRLTLAAIAALLRRHLSAGDPMAAYAERLDDPALPDVVRGYLTGSLDLVLRTDGRFAVVDYKTNWLAASGEELSAWHYRPEALAAEMRRGHYGLQALLYTAALHRFLRWRVPGYDPATHVAGVLYLFVRGMSGPETPVVDGMPCGVFGWTPPGALVEALSDLLDEGAA
jgi:exodeoxyribonuclease V beta subunit